MKKYSLEFSVLAKHDLVDIWHYFSLYDENTAHFFIEALQKRMLQLEIFPFLGAMHKAMQANERFLTFKKYNIFYRIESNNIIFIRRILHGSREMKDFL